MKKIKAPVQGVGNKNKLFFAVLAAAVLAVFGQAVFFKEQILDDIIYAGRLHLLEPSLNNLKLWWEPVLGLWGPLTGYSFMLDHLLWGKEYFLAGAHGVNILLHLTAAAAFYTGARMLKIPALAAGLAVLYWTLHPQRAESVVWLSERKDVLLLALGLWCIVFFIKAVRKKSLSLLGIAALLFALSFFIKPALIGLPLILTAYLWGRYRKKELRFYLKHTGLFWLLSLIYCTAFLCAAPGSAQIGASSLRETFLLAGWRYGSYFVKTLLPLDLNPMYPHFSPADTSPGPLYAAAGCALWLGLYLLKKNKQAVYLYLPLFLSYSAAVSPALLKIGDVDFADRYSYFPSVFITLAAVCGLCALVRRRPPLRQTVIVLSGALICLMGVMCFKEVRVWQTNASYRAATMNSPKPNYRCVIGEAILSFDKGNTEEALLYIGRLRQDYIHIPPARRATIRHFTDSLEGVILLRSGRRAEGTKKLFQVLSSPQWELLLNTSYGYPRFILLTAAGLSQRAGHKKDAAELYRRIARLYGTFEPLEKEFYLALAALCLDDKAAALEHFERAHRLNPKDGNVRKNIEILRKQKR